MVLGKTYSFFRGENTGPSWWNHRWGQQHRGFQRGRLYWVHFYAVPCVGRPDKGAGGGAGTQTRWRATRRSLLLLAPRRPLCPGPDSGPRCHPHRRQLPALSRPCQGWGRWWTTAFCPHNLPKTSKGPLPQCHRAAGGTPAAWGAAGSSQAPSAERIRASPGSAFPAPPRQPAPPCPKPQPPAGTNNPASRGSSQPAPVDPHAPTPRRVRGRAHPSPPSTRRCAHPRVNPPRPVCPCRWIPRKPLRPLLRPPSYVNLPGFTYPLPTAGPAKRFPRAVTAAAGALAPRCSAARQALSRGGLGRWRRLRRGRYRSGAAARAARSRASPAPFWRRGDGLGSSW